MSKQDKEQSAPIPVGSESVGQSTDNSPTGSEAFGGPDGKHPLRGALLFGNDPQGKPRGSEAIGNPDPDEPLRGALLFGNDPQGNPRGSEAFGNPDAESPLRGALLFGNDPQGEGRGSESFGTADAEYPYRGALAFGAPQHTPGKLHRDTITYDFVGRLLRSDDASLAGIRKDPNDRIRERVLEALGRYLAIQGERLRHGLNEHAIPWGRLKRQAASPLSVDAPLDMQLACELRDWYRRAPGEVLGVGHVQALLESTERMHSFELRCEWDVRPWHVHVLWNGEAVAYASSTVHKEQSYFIFKDPQGETVAYIDALVPRRGEQTARMRSATGQLVALLTLTTPSLLPEAQSEMPAPFVAHVTDHADKLLFEVREQRSTARYFKAELTDPQAEACVGMVEDKLAEGKIRAMIELDLRLPRMVAWGTAVMMADLARLRRSGWPDPPERAEPEIESIEEALGPRRPRRRY